MNAEDFRRLALSLPGTEESSHMGAPDFRVGGKIFATLASQKQGYGNLALTPAQQAVRLARENQYDEAAQIYAAVTAGRRAARMRQLAALYREANRAGSTAEELAEAKVQDGGIHQCHAGQNLFQ